MANIVRLVACVAIIIGLLGELSLGLLLPSRIKVEYAYPHISHLVPVDLPTSNQAVPWCNSALSPDERGQRIDCDFIPVR
jgi:hypothetical protein